MAKDDLISRKAVLEAIEALQQSPWYGDEKDTAYHHRYLTRKEAVEIVRDLAVKSVPTIDAIPVEWLCKKVFEEGERENILHAEYIKDLILEWQKEQEAQDG